MITISLATFHWNGFVPAIMITVFWTVVFQNQSRVEAFGIGCLLLLLFGPLGRLAVTRETEEGPQVWRRQCASNLRAIAIALNTYHEDFGSFPPAYVPDEKGEPMHSWRVLILPYLEEQVLYERYDFREAWNGPNNSKLLAKMPMVYGCPAPSGDWRVHMPFTSYLAVVDSRTAWPGPQGRTFDEIKAADCESRTILLIEVSGQQIPWMEPRDLSLDEALRIVGEPNPNQSGVHRERSFFFAHDAVRNVLMADSRVRPVVEGVSAKWWNEALIIDDRAGWSAMQYEADASYGRLRPRLDNWFRLALFVLVMLFPLPWVWRKRSTDIVRPAKTLM